MADDTTPRNPDIAWAIQDIKDRAPRYARRRNYYEGKHLPVIPEAHTVSPVLYALLQDLSDNLCDDVVDETVSRLEVVGWSEPDRAGDDVDGASGPSPRAVRANELWDANRGPAREAQTWRDMFGQGDAFTIVEKGKDGRVRWHPQDPSTMAVAYWEDRPDSIRVAAKVWRSGTRYRLNLYYSPDPQERTPARLERYATRGTSHDGGIPDAKAFQPYIVMDEATGQPEDPARDWSRNPVFHFPCQEVGRYGRSTLTGVIPLQDALNKALADLLVRMEDDALPARYGTGIQVDPNPDGTPGTVRRRARKASDMITTPSTDASFGQFAGADMAPFLAVLAAHRAEIARKGYLPSYSVPTGEQITPASGLAMLVAEGRQVKRCKTVGQRDGGFVWREQMAYMLTLDGIPTTPEDLDIEWAPVQTRDEAALWELLAVKQAMGVPRHVLLVEGGYDPEEVEAWLEDAAASTGGRVSMPGPGIASVTVPGMPGGMAVPAAGGLPSAPQAPAGAATPPLSA